VSQKCLEDYPSDKYGFIYLIIGPEEKIYVGKKAFLHKTRAKMSKKDKLVVGNEKKRVKVGTKDSGWKNYYGSSKELLADITKLGKDKFERYILDFADNKADLTLKEIEFQVKYNVLRCNSYNGWIGGKVFKRHL
jgi:hypothetical protein